MGMLATTLLLSILASPGDLANGDFEAKPSKSDPVPGWSVEIGARNGGDQPLSEVKVDTKQKHGGRRSLHLAAGSGTFAFQIVSQSIAVRPDGRYRLQALSRTKNVRREINAKGIQQFNNCYLALFLFDGLGELVARDIATPRRPSTDGWQLLELSVEAPTTVRRAEIKMFLSVSGDVWFDDLELTIEGGEPVPEPALVFAEDFEDLRELPAAWLVEEGARNGGDAPGSTVEVDRREGYGKSKRSLHLQGSKKTIVWYMAGRAFAAAPGDVFHLSGQIRAEGVQQQRNVLGINQFANLHTSLVFFDADDRVVGAARHDNPGDGSFDWEPLSVRAVAPEGALRGRAGCFLSMTGEVWIDDLSLTRQGGGVPAYDGWLRLASKRLVLRFPADHPRADSMDAYAERLEAELQHAEKALKLAPSDEPITMFLYRDGEQGKALTGRSLDFAEPERRAVHQRPNSTLCHELVHVIALQLGYAQTGLLGEGIAVWLDGSGAAFHHDRAAGLLATSELPDLDALVGAFRDQLQGYSAAGSFCGWLLKTHGVEAFSRLYPAVDLAAAAPHVLGRPLVELDADWREFLAQRHAGDG